MPKHLPLPDGRAWELHEYGDPTGHPTLFFHGLIGSHVQASFIESRARQSGIRIIAPNRPGVGRSDFVRRVSPLEIVPDVEFLLDSLSIPTFSLIGISGGAPYALACLLRLGDRVRTTTLISGMGPMRLPGALKGMDSRRRLILNVGARSRHLAIQAFQNASNRFHSNPDRFLNRLVSTWPPADRALFARREIFDLFLQDLHAVFTHGVGAPGMAQELALYRNYGFSLADLPPAKLITLWQGIDDTVVPPAMAWEMTRLLPRCETHFVPGGHFVAITIAHRILARLVDQLQSA